MPAAAEQYRRALAPSEALFAAGRSTVAYSVFGTGAIDVPALTTAFAALRRAYPVLAGRIADDGTGYVLLPSHRTPGVRIDDSEPDGPPPDSTGLVEPDEVCAVTLAQHGNDFRLSLLTHHSIADAPASLRYLEVLCAMYTRAVETGALEAPTPQPLPRSVEAVLAARGIGVDSPPDAALEPALPRPPEPDANPPTVRFGRTRLTADETARLFAAARRAGLTVHGVVCAAILLAAHDLSSSGAPTDFTAVSSVDLRRRVRPVVAPESGTVIQGSDAVTLTVDPAGEPHRLGRAVLDSLAANLANRVVHQSFLRGRAALRPAGPRPLMITNWGPVPHLVFPKGVTAHDFRASAGGARTGAAHNRPPSFFVTTFADRLSLDHPAWVPAGTDPTADTTAALRRAFTRLIG